MAPVDGFDDWKKHPRRGLRRRFYQHRHEAGKAWGIGTLIIMSVAPLVGTVSGYAAYSFLEDAETGIWVGVGTMIANAIIGYTLLWAAGNENRGDMNRAGEEGEALGLRG